MITILNNLRTDLGNGGAGLMQAGDPFSLFSYLKMLGSAVNVPPATQAALQGVLPADRADGQVRVVGADQTVWQYVAASTVVGATGLSLVPSDAPSAGRWLRVAVSVDIKLPIGFATADAAVLLTVPAGMKLRMNRVYWEVTTSFTGGATPAIGVSSTNTNFSTKGDLLGGASGDLTATLVSTGSPYKGGTLGAKFGSNGVIVLVGGDVVRYDRIASAFTAGAGFVHVEADLIG